MGLLIFLFVVCATASSQSFSDRISLRSPPQWPHKSLTTTIAPGIPTSIMLLPPSLRWNKNQDDRKPGIYNTSIKQLAPPLRGFKNKVKQPVTVTPIPRCPPEEITTGCKLVGLECKCGPGCKSDFLFRNRATCANALRERSTNICYHQPCERGICIQTQQEPGFSCKCEGTGYHGQRCEKACPIKPQHGLVFPHECIVI